MSDWIIPEWPAPASVKACITTRAEGVSEGPYASFNLATHVGDSPERVSANRAYLRAQLGLSQEPQWLEQVHGTQVVEARADGWVRTADGCDTGAPGLACAILTADCLPVLLCNRRGTRVAAVHAGWRGLAGGIVGAAVGRFDDPSEELMAYLGPAISQRAFEVGVEVLEAFFEGARSDTQVDAIAGAFTPSEQPLKFHADIYALARAELAALGITEVYGGDFCTHAESDRFYSYRRDKATGRQASLIWLA